MSRAPSGLAGALCKGGRAFRQVGRFHRPEQTRPGEFGRAHAPRRTPAAKLPRAPKSVRRTVCRDSGGPAATLAVPWRARSAALAALSDSESALGKTAARGVPSHTNGSARPAHSRCSRMGCCSEPPFHASFPLPMQPPVYISTRASTPVPGLSSHSQSLDPSLCVSRPLGARRRRLQALPCSKEEPLQPRWDPRWSSGLPELAAACECACARM